MNGIQKEKPRRVDEPFPGCLGRMVNLFDLSPVVAGNRLLTDKPHHDCSSLSRSRSDVARMSSPSFGDRIEDKMIVSEFRRTSSNRKSNGTPMKMLIDQEMSKDMGSKHNPPNVVAKLMGLDSLPRQQPDLAAQRSHSRRSLSHSGIPMEWQQDHGFLDKEMQCEVHQCEGQNEYKDVYEIWQQFQKTNHVRDQSPQKGRNNENVNEKNMALVRQKFMEAKRLATDEKLRQSKEFQDALEVLSSNKDLFLKFLQEPNSLFSQHLYGLQSIPPPPETKRITVLRPSKMVGNDKFTGSEQKSEKAINRPARVGQVTGWDKNLPGFSPPFSNQKVDEFPAQPTRIVVLKPNHGKAHDTKAVVAPPSSSPRILHTEDFYKEPEDNEARESRETAKEITRQMRENLMSHRRDETLLSSVFSNGYIGDESSFTKSENEYAVGNLSDSEVMSPTSKHSWDYVNRFGSPYSSSPFSRASYSPESSVCREAKKRLSERWAMMASNGSAQEQRHVRKSSSTLGEMLALSDTKKAVIPEEKDTGSNKEQEQEPKGSTSCLTSNLNKEEGTDVSSPKSLPRSKSVPVSSTVYGARVNVEDPEAAPAPKELTKAKSMKSSLKGKVSSLFFSRNKKSSKEKSSISHLNDKSHSATAEIPGSLVHSPGKIINDAFLFINDTVREECASPGIQGLSSKTSLDTTSMGQQESIVSREAGLSVAKPSGNVNENQDQPSPISVLEPPFEEDDNTTPKSADNFQQDHRGTQVLGNSLKSNLIDKSPPIESISRTLSWDDSCAETGTPYLLKPNEISSGTEGEEQEWLVLFQNLLSVAGLNSKVNANSFFPTWHSPETPLDPSLRDKYANQNDKDPLPEAKRRQRRSSRKLVFDCVNAALVEIISYGSDNRLLVGTSPILVDHVWALLKEWFSGEVKCFWGDSGDSNSLVVEMMVRKEVVGRGWVEHMQMELDNVGREMEKNLLEMLVEEAVVDMTGRV